jgi:transaldolase
MNATRQLRDLGQSLWLDNITRSLLTSGTLARYIKDFAVTGLTSNPTIFEQAIGKSDAYDETIRLQADADQSIESLFFGLAIEDLRRAAELFRPVFDASGGANGWVSLEVSPLLADDATKTIEEAARLHARAACPNLFIKIPGTPAGILAIEESIFAGLPINVTLLFSCAQYLAAAEAYLRGIERRIAAGRDPLVDSVASLFVSRWDVATHEQLPPALRNRLGIAVASQTYRAYRKLLASERWSVLAERGARAQRLLWASTGTKDPAAPDTMYIEALIAPDTINTIPEKTLAAFADHGKVGLPMPFDDYGADADGTPTDDTDAYAVIADCRRVGIDVATLALTLQREGAQSFSKSWHGLLSGLHSKREALIFAKPS